MSTQVVAVIINLLVMVLPFIGINIASDQVTNTVQTLVAIVTGLYIWYERTTLQKAPNGVGDVNALGARK